MSPSLKRVRALLTKEGRQSQRLFLVEGVRLIEEAFASPVRVRCLYHEEPESGSRLSHLVAAAVARGVPTTDLAAKELAALCDTQTPQGAVAVVETTEWTPDDVWKTGEGDVVVLDNVRDPGNLGTLLRSAEAAGARGVLLMPGTVDVTNPKAVRASMGAIFRLPVVRVSTVGEVASRARDLGIPLVVSSPHLGKPAASLLEQGSIAIVLGGEAEGASRDWDSLCEFTVSLAQKKGTESLNVAVAGSILLFRNAWRQS